MAPMPEHDGICRWCGKALRALVDGGPVNYCSAGCSSNDAPLYTADCGLCGREFKTGQRWANTCHECSEQEHRAITKAVQAVKPRSTYHFSETKRGGYRD